MIFVHKPLNSRTMACPPVMVKLILIVTVLALMLILFIIIRIIIIVASVLILVLVLILIMNISYILSYICHNKNTISEKGKGNHLINSTSLRKAQSPVSGFCHARNRVCGAVLLYFSILPDPCYITNRTFPSKLNCIPAESSDLTEFDCTDFKIRFFSSRSMLFLRWRWSRYFCCRKHFRVCAQFTSE